MTDTSRPQRPRTIAVPIETGFALVELIFENGRPVDHLVIEANPAFARQLARQRLPHADLHGHVHHDAVGEAFEREAKRYRFALPVSAAPVPRGEGDEAMRDGGEHAAQGEEMEETVEVTDTFVLDVRSGTGRFVFPLEDEEDEDEEEEVEEVGSETGGMEVDGVGA